jgi:hypothetical protein
MVALTLRGTQNCLHPVDKQKLVKEKPAQGCKLMNGRRGS